MRILFIVSFPLGWFVFRRIEPGRRGGVKKTARAPPGVVKAVSHLSGVRPAGAAAPPAK